MPHPIGDMELDQVPTGTLARILATTDGTIATILEAYVGEAVRVVKISQAFEAGDSQSPLLPIRPEERVLRRSVVLRGRRTGLNFLYADCIVRADCLPPEILKALVSTDQPMRRIFTEARIGTFEEMVGAGREPAGACARHFDVAPTASPIWRSYRILLGQEPVIVISERFPPELFC